MKCPKTKTQNYTAVIKTPHAYTIYKQNGTTLCQLEVRNIFECLLKNPQPELNFPRIQCPLSPSRLSILPHNSNTGDAMSGRKLIKRIQLKSLESFKSDIGNWKPEGCKCRLCKEYIPDLGYIQTRKMNHVYHCS